MTPERLDEIRYLNEVVETDDRTELLDYVDELIRQLADARDIAARAGAFVSGSGEVYIDHCGPCAAAS